MKTAIIVGATGLTGSKLTAILLQSGDYEKVHIFVRRDSGIRHEKLVQHIIDFDTPASYEGLIGGDDLFCCLGTTIKKAKTRENFEKVDLTYPSQFAKAAGRNGVKRFYLISSIGADPDSSNFYLRTKGRCEEKVIQNPFQGIGIFRPSLLLGDRNEFRLGEKVSSIGMRLISVFLRGRLKKYRPVKAEQLARAMYHTAKEKPCGVNSYESDKIQDM